MKQRGKKKERRKIQGFKDILLDCELNDAGFKGQKFTWFGIREGEWIKERLDRCLINMDSQETFSRMQVFNLPAVGSDHYHIFIDIDFRDLKGKYRFKFDANWTSIKECDRIIRNGWTKQFEGSKCYQLVRKLKYCKDNLKTWSREKNPNNKKLIEALMKEVVGIQENKMTEVEELKMQEIKDQLKDAWDREKQYWFQKSKVKWLKAGDQNSWFFHQSTLQRRRFNKILKIRNGNRA